MKIKNLLMTFLLFAFVQGLVAQNSIILTEGFEDGYEDFWQISVFPEIEEPDVLYGTTADEGYDDVVAYEGNFCFFIYGGDQVDTYLISPMLTGTDNGLKVSFYYTNYYEESPSYFKVGYSLFSDDVSSFVWGETIYVNEIENWLHYENEFPAGTKYVAIKYFWEDNYYVFLDDFSFETVSCAMPSKPMLVAATTNSVSVSWTGSNDLYNLRYSKCDYYDFEEDEPGWSSFDSKKNVNVWYLTGTDDDVEPHSGDNCMGSATTRYEADNYLISPLIELGDSISFYAKCEGAWKGSHSSDATYDGQFQVLVTTDENPTVESHYDILATKTAVPDAWIQVAVSLKDYTGTGHVVIKHLYWDDEGAYNPNLYIDDVLILSASSQISNLPGNTEIYELTSLDEETSYAIELQGICEDPETSKVFETSWTEPLYVKTLPSEAPSAYEFVNDGEWSQPNNWSNWYMPQSDDDYVTISANAVVPAGCVAKGTIIDMNGGSITIQDGGQLKHNNGTNSNITVTAMKGIAAYPDEGKTGYYLIASPIVDVTCLPTNVTNMLSNDYDLYYFDQYEALEWQNYKKKEFDLNLTQGFLYANSNDVNLVFTGPILPSDDDFSTSLDYVDGVGFAGWNLVGNPFMCDAYIGRPFYRLTPESDELEPVENGAIAPLEGVFVKAEDENDDAISFSREETSKGSVLNVNVIREEADIDVARVRFGEGHNLEKFQLNPNHTKVYFPQNGRNYAVVNAGNIDELPFNFESENDGTFTLSFTQEQVDFSYLHLIDNLTGADVDLLQEPEYTFESTVSDYPSRFRLVFVAKDTEGNVENSESFAFNSNGNFIIVNEGLAILQVIDLQGRMISSETIEGCVSKNLQAAPGVYVLRLINGDNVMTQKIVVR